MLSLLMVQGSGPPDGPGELVAKAVWLGMQTSCSEEPKGGVSCNCAVLVGAGPYTSLIVWAPCDHVMLNSRSVSLSSGYVMVRT